jgi:hypothetical protein
MDVLKQLRGGFLPAGGSRREQIVGVIFHDATHVACELRDFARGLVCDYFGEGYWRVGEGGLDRVNVLSAFGVSAGRVSFEYRGVGESFRLIEDGLAPVASVVQ